MGQFKQLSDSKGITDMNKPSCKWKNNCNTNNNDYATVETNI